MSINYSIIYSSDKTILIEVLPFVEHIDIDFRCTTIARFCFASTKCRYLLIPPYVTNIPLKICEHSYFLERIEITGNSLVNKDAFLNAKKLSTIIYGGTRVQHQVNITAPNSVEVFVCRNYASSKFLNVSVKIDQIYPCFYAACKTLRCDINGLNLCILAMIIFII